MAKKGTRLSCGIDVGFKPDLESSLESSCREGYDFICVDIVNSEKKLPFLKCDVGQRIGDACNTDFMLKSQDWSTLVVGKLSLWLGSNFKSNIQKAIAEEATLQELNFAAYLSLPAVLVSITNSNCTNLAKTIYSHLLKSHHCANMWIRIPLTSAIETSNGTVDEEDSYENTWLWWNKFRSLCNQHNRVGVVLEITADLPEEVILKQWFGEPIRAVMLPTSIFLINKKGYPVLSRAHQFLMMQFFRLNCQVVITGPCDHNSGIRVYQQYVNHLYDHRPPMDQYETFSKGYEDYLQSPLQPLMDNLESATYEVFEKDPVKYVKYEEAIFKCLNDKFPDPSVTKAIPVVVMVLGAGRGPLVRAALVASQRSDRKIKCYAVEKNANAAVTLNLLRRTEWKNEDITVVSCDMRSWKAPELADIIVSELLGSFGDNELSPECLDGAERFLKPEAVSIPCAYTSYMSPASSQKLYNEVTAASVIDHDKPKEQAFETPYVVRIHNYHELAKAKPVFTFEHPNLSNHVGDATESHAEFNHLKNCRSVELSFEIPCDSLLHGFAGYFHCTLYDDVFISIVPESHSPGMFSWFPIFFPLLNPIPVSQGSNLVVEIWRQCTEQKVWYEWAVTHPQTTSIHNPGGRSYTIGL